MTFAETAAAMRRLADVIERVVRERGQDTSTGAPKPAFSEEGALGAALMLTFLRDLITNSDRDQWDRPSILVLLETVSRDSELFPCGTGTLMWAMEDEPEEP